MPHYSRASSFLILFAVVALLIIRQFGTKRDRSRGTLIIVLGLILGGGLSFGVGTGFNSLAPHQKVRIELFFMFITSTYISSVFAIFDLVWIYKLIRRKLFYNSLKKNTCY